MMHIEILGKGCEKCRRLTANAREAAETLGLEVEIVHVTDVDEIGKRGPVMTPVLVVDGQIRSMGRALSPRAVTKILEECVAGERSG